jgi:hypothetical protein
MVMVAVMVAVMVVIVVIFSVIHTRTGAMLLSGELD